MGAKDYYTIRTYGEKEHMYVVKKFDEDINFIEQYFMSVIPGDAVICNCPAGGRVTCRHRKMLRIFQAEKKIDSGMLYNFDRNAWRAPLGTGGDV